MATVAYLEPARPAWGFCRKIELQQDSGLKLSHKLCIRDQIKPRETASFVQPRPGPAARLESHICWIIQERRERREGGGEEDRLWLKTDVCRIFIELQIAAITAGKNPCKLLP